MHNSSKAQIKSRKAKRNRLKPVRMAWRQYLKREVLYVPIT